MKKAAFVALVVLRPCFAQNSSVAGRVTNAAGEPLKGAVVHLLQNVPPAITFETGADGSFVFQNLSPGRYNLHVQRENYLSADYGSILTVAAGQQVTGISLKMTRAALFVGRVLDPDGDPVPNVSVNALAGDVQGSLATSRADGSFVIGGLEAGAYSLRATDSSQPAQGREVSGPKEAFVTTYYPGVTDASKATLVRVEAGAELRGLEIRMRKSGVFRVSGKAVNAATNTPVGNLGVTLAEDDPGIRRSEITPADGSFEFLRVPPGDYILTDYATARDPLNLVGHLAVTVRSDAEGLVLKLGPGLAISGKIGLEGGGEVSKMNVDLGAAERRIQFRTGDRGDGVVSSDGSFALHNIDPDVYNVRVHNRPAGTYIKAMHYGDRDLTGNSLDLTIEKAGGKTLDILLSPHAAEVTGTVRDSQGAPRLGVWVIVWTAAGKALDSDRTDQNGAFRLSDLPPGDYRLAAWEQFPEDATKAEKSVSVTLREDSHESVEPPLVEQKR